MYFFFNIYWKSSEKISIIIPAPYCARRTANRRTSVSLSYVSYGPGTSAPTPQFTVSPSTSILDSNYCTVQPKCDTVLDSWKAVCKLSRKGIKRICLSIDNRFCTLRVFFYFLLLWVIFLIQTLDDVSFEQ